VLGGIVGLARNTPDSVGDGEEWKQVICNIIEDKTNLCSLLQGKRLYCALYGMNTVTLSDRTDVLQRGSFSTIPDGSIAAASVGPPRTEPSSDEFWEPRRRKRNNSSDGEVRSLKKPAQPDPEKTPAIRNYFAPLRTAEMDIEDNSPAAEGSTPLEQQSTSPKKGRPPPIVLTSAANLISLQRNLKGLLKDNFEFRSTRNGTRVVTRDMEDYQTVRKHFDSNIITYFTFHPKSEKLIKATIRHLPSDTPTEDISNVLQDLGYSILSVRQMTSLRASE
jgi:hypothetical protein